MEEMTMGNWLDNVSWKNLLDVVNCAKYGDDILKEHAYMCPTDGSSYEHRRCKYFGSYRNKRVELVAAIVAVVDIHSLSSSSIRWKIGDEPEDLIRKMARERHQTLRPNDYPKRVFLLSDVVETDFRKDTPGGMQSSKKYFDVTRLGPFDAKDLAEKLKKRTWSNF
jgi:hypothetical protein